MTRPQPRYGRALVAGLASPWLAAIALAFFVGVHVVQATAAGLAAAAPTAARGEALAAHLLADEAALAAFGRRRPRVDAAAPGAEATVLRDGASLHVCVRDEHGGARWFRGDVLAGAPAAAFTRALTVGEDGALALPGAYVDPALATAAASPVVAGAPCAVAAGLVVRDPAVALQQFVGGTDLDDFLFADGDVDLACAGGLVVVPGNLWLEASAAPRTVRASRDVVVVVRGNLYLGRSLRVVGGGRLVLAAVADEGAAVFADRDGDGRLGGPDRLLRRGAAAGPIEGAGGIVVFRQGREPLACDAALFADGALHLRRSLQCEGPVALAHGAEALAAGADLVARGRWRFHGQRDAVAGFPTGGGARPGFLRPSAPPVGAASENLPLYLSGPLR
jgi:hypothetical protein